MSSVFTKKMNPVTGKLEWVVHDENYDFHQEIARSAFADMLHDTERNQKYYEGIKMAVEKMHRREKEAHVLDIGTGTGLLSMMAAKCGADTIVACEAFKPMAECAKKVIAENGHADKIHLVAKRSTELTVGEDGDMKHRANILVTEVFDTELIGEGALSTFIHAHDNLLEDDCIVVPSSATVYAQVVQSNLAVRWNKLFPFTDPQSGRVLLDIPPTVCQCPGAAAVQDIQLNQLPLSEFVALTDPVQVFTFDWLGQIPLEYHETVAKVVRTTQGGLAHAVFMWWDLAMDTEGMVMLSCAPWWVRSDEAPAWRDHWMQAVYHLPQHMALMASDEFVLNAYHDEYSLWFDICKDVSSYNIRWRDSPTCICCLHVSCSRTRLGAMNDPCRREKYLGLLDSLPGLQQETCLCLGETSLLGLLAGVLGAGKVYCVEENSLARRMLVDFLDHNAGDLRDRVVLAPSIHSLQPAQLQEVTLVLSEPHFGSALLPWQNLHFWYQKEALVPLLGAYTDVVPRAAAVWAVPVEFEHLWKIRAPLGSVEGFSMSHFDALIEKSRGISDSMVEPQPLWEYPCKALGRPTMVLEFNFTKNIPKCAVHNSGDIPFTSDGVCHGVALWVDWDLDGEPKHAFSTGPVSPVDPGSKVTWDMHTRQGVYFFPNHHRIALEPVIPSLQFETTFQPSDGDLSFTFKVMRQ